MQATSSVFRYKPFLVTFVLSLLGTCTYTIMIILARDCSYSCVYANVNRYYDCYIGGSHFCCSGSSGYGPTSCGNWTDCVNTSNFCYGYYIGIYVSVSITAIFLILMVITAYLYCQKKKNLTQAPYPNLIYAQPVYNMDQQQPPIMYGNYQNLENMQNNSVQPLRQRNWSSSTKIYFIHNLLFKSDYNFNAAEKNTQIKKAKGRLCTWRAWLR